MLGRFRRTTWLLLVPTLLGALLLMHGSVGHGGAAAVASPDRVATAEAHPHHDPPTDHGRCDECSLGHVMVVCVGLVTAVGGVALARRSVARTGLRAVAVAAAAGRVRRRVEVARPPDPAWIRLSVMRC